MGPLYVCFQVAQHAEDVPTIRTRKDFFGTVNLFVAIQKRCSPKGHVASVALEILPSFSVDLLVFPQGSAGLECHLTDIAGEWSDVHVHIQMRIQLTRCHKLIIADTTEKRLFPCVSSHVNL